LIVLIGVPISSGLRYLPSIPVSVFGHSIRPKADKAGPLH
jgi:hypothetical protein